MMRVRMAPSGSRVGFNHDLVVVVEQGGGADQLPFGQLVDGRQRDLLAAAFRAQRAEQGEEEDEDDQRRREQEGRDRITAEETADRREDVASPFQEGALALVLCETRVRQGGAAFECSSSAPSRFSGRLM